ncbi:TPM domain-containing protein [Microbacter sp. GSS18]|nr:TPM domain-containing protein [Microbacter sp. GSS18]
MRRRWATALLSAGMTALMLAGAASAAATDPVQLGSEYVLDDVGAIAPGDAGNVQSSLEQLYADTGADLYVAFVDTFTNPDDSESWANAVAAQNGLGPSQYLLAVATESRQYYLSADSSGPLSQEQIAQVEADILPQLRDGDYAGAVVTAADTMRGALGGGASGGGFGTVILIVVVAAAIAVVVWLVIRSRRRKRSVVAADGGDPLDRLSTAELRAQAASALIETDDAIKTSEQELGFAAAQFGEAATGPFVEALAAARAELTEAFSLQQKLDDAEPDTEDQVRAWNARIIELCDQAGTRLDERAAEFDELRKLEQDAPEALARLQAERIAATTATRPAADRLAALRASYAPEALATIADNPAQAETRLEFADEQLAAAQQAIARGDGGEAAVSIRAAEEAIGQATMLADAIGRLGDDLSAAEKNAAALIADIEQDVAAAGALPDADGRVAAAVTAASQQLEAARAELAGAKDPLAAIAGLEAADDQIDAVIARARDEQARARRAQQMLAQTMTQAQARVSTAEDYITARRGAVGAPARTRLAEAGASLVRARQLQSSDPAQALAQAQRADQLAAQAIQSAQSDVSGFGGMGAGTQPGMPGGGMLGAVLGGIVINAAMGGGRSSASRGGFGGFPGASSAGRSRPRMSSGSFGGGGTRARRGGGRF